MKGRITEMILDILYDGPKMWSVDAIIAKRVLGHNRYAAAVAANYIRDNVIRISPEHMFNRIHQYHAEHSR